MNIFHRIKKYSNILFHFSFMALLVMNIDRCLAVSYPFFHKLQVTKQRLVVFLIIILNRKSPCLPKHVCDHLLCRRDCFSRDGSNLLVAIFIINCKIYKMAKKARRGLVTTISTCILAIACFILFSISTPAYILTVSNLLLNFLKLKYEVKAHTNRTRFTNATRSFSV